MELQPPPITIVDPRRGGSGDVLDAGPERSGRRGALVLAVVLVVGGTAFVANLVRDDRADDRAATSAVRLATEVAADTGLVPAGWVRIGVRNDGPEPVRLVSARLLATGYAPAELDATLPSGGSATLAFRDTARCSPDLLTAPAESVSVRLRTGRGTTVTRELALSPGAYDDVNRPARERCGYLPAEESFALALSSVHVVGADVVVTAAAANHSVLPLQLLRLRQTPGLSLDVSSALPIQLPVQATPGTTDRTVSLTLRFRVTDCRVFLEALGFPNPTQISQQLLRAWVVRDSTAFELQALTVDPSRSYRQHVDPATVLDRLVRMCVDV